MSLLALVNYLSFSEGKTGMEGCSWPEGRMGVTGANILCS